MDELLPRPRSIFAPPSTRVETPVRKKFALPELKLGWSLPNFLERRTKAGPAIFLALSLSATAAAVMGTLYAPAFQVAVDGTELGLIGSRQSVEDAVQRVEDRASTILGYDYSLTQTITYTPQMALKEEQTSVSGVETYLFDQIGEIMQTSVLTVNGQVLGATDDAEGLNALLESIKAPYINENTISAEFTTPVVVSRAYTPTADLREISSMAKILTSNSMEQVDYTVKAGDTLSAIAQNFDMTMDELQTLNPDINPNLLSIDQVLVTSQAVPFLSVRTVDNLTYEGPVPYEVEEVADENMYQGYSQILVEGVDGSAIYNADVVYVNGTEEDRIINSTDVLTEPVTQVVAVGTKPRPKTMATDTFKWPCWGNISSYFGSRYIFGGYSVHYGIDIAANYGTAIYASDGGKVIWSGYRDNGFGYYVVIDHENGYQTYYAHCSSLCVSAGERVYQGQLIAKVGSTGRSTGNHCHFQVMKNGSAINPLTVLP